MEPTTRLEPDAVARRVLAVALAVGMLGDALLRVVPWGLNAWLWIVALGACLLLVRDGSPRRGRRGAVAASVALAAAFVLRDSWTLQWWSTVALALTLPLAALAPGAGPLRRLGVGTFLLAPLTAMAHAALGPGGLLAGAGDPLGEGRRLRRHALAAGRGVLLALPPLVVFGLLFVSADAFFARLAEHLLGDLESLALHALVTALVAWPAAGFLRAAAFPPVAPPAPPPRRPALGAVECGVVLGSLDALFLAFVLVQLRSLFGGEAHVQATLGLTYAEYARRGFFELVTVTALALPLLLGLDALRPRGARGGRLFTTLAALTLALLGLIVLSALQRMRLYVGEYGLTEARVYATAIVLWLVGVFGWFALTVLRGARARFAFGAWAGAVAVLLALLVANPAAWVVRVNAARAAHSGRFDAWYATSLGADAVPALLAALPSLPPADRCLAATWLRERWRPPESVDWRGWNLARARAWGAVGARSSELRRLACPVTSGRSP